MNVLTSTMVCVQTRNNSHNRRNDNAMISDLQQSFASRTSHSSHPLHDTRERDRCSRPLRSNSPAGLSALPQKATFSDLTTTGRPRFAATLQAQLMHFDSAQWLRCYAHSLAGHTGIDL